MTSTVDINQPSAAGAALSRHGNEFDILRLVLAFAVVVSHMFSMTGRMIPSLEAKDSAFIDDFSGIAVMSFFMLSGFLTYHSYLMDQRLWAFYAKRFFRIFPVYWFIIFAQVIVFALIYDVSFSDSKLLKYLGANLLFLNFLQPSFVDALPAFNGALWTLKVEVAYYAILPFLFFALRNTRLLLILMALSLAWNLLLPIDIIARQLPGKIYLFGIGILIHRYRHELAASRALPWVVALIGLIGVKYVYQGADWVRLVDNAIAFVLVPLAMRRFLPFELKYDLSYTLYVVHFPLVMLSTQFLPIEMSLPIRFLILVPAAFLCAYAITRLIELPGINYGRAFIRRRFPRTT